MGQVGVRSGCCAVGSWTEHHQKSVLVVLAKGEFGVKTKYQRLTVCTVTIFDDKRARAAMCGAQLSELSISLSYPAKRCHDDKLRQAQGTKPEG